ncbi:hypothetical protein DFH07DRAFT_768033 [Mycena maculata]|uniref:Uncharacterized protein n=1 Tax=Mycena maculata TaxID=230809 RepID=A0AAD7NSH0_9AGAR|nr:hypothetical protein DFH07DRAFT_768033 [Mycena maculata]
MNAELSEDELIRMMGQNPNSKQFYARCISLTCPNRFLSPDFQHLYQSRLSVIDLGAILVERHDENAENTRIMKTLIGMSKTWDPDALVSPDIVEKNELDLDPELVAFCVAKKKVMPTFSPAILMLKPAVQLLERVNVERTQFFTVDTEAERAVSEAIIRELRKEIHDIERKHSAIRSTKNTLTRPLNGNCLGSNPPFVFPSLHPVNRPAPSKENVPPVAAATLDIPAAAALLLAPHGRVSRPAISDPMDNTLQIIYNFTLEDAGTVHFAKSVNALLGLPTRPFKLCYPGESPTHDDKCPVCGLETM